MLSSTRLVQFWNTLAMFTQLAGRPMTLMPGSVSFAQPLNMLVMFVHLPAAMLSGNFTVSRVAALMNMLLSVVTLAKLKQDTSTVFTPEALNMLTKVVTPDVLVFAGLNVTDSRDVVFWNM